ncbi:hypothetical protein AVEN_125076-1 [Araneus ventricosus]|uniref:Uncharacterized protein n=1 Tax=Araneus ventricosus TaxID=182803 RepID=A0A4Y2TJA5_ARAVE|nr:hypothetical protein AVEN_125076-1 [Araneus ventricosus]
MNQFCLPFCRLPCPGIYCSLRHCILLLCRLLLHSNHCHLGSSGEDARIVMPRPYADAGCGSVVLAFVSLPTRNLGIVCVAGWMDAGATPPGALQHTLRLNLPPARTVLIWFAVPGGSCSVPCRMLDLVTPDLLFQCPLTKGIILKTLNHRVRWFQNLK